MNPIPRRSIMTLTDKEIEELRETNKKEMSDLKIDNRNYLIYLYYLIAMEDYWTYRDLSSNPQLKNVLQDRLINRALYSAKLQVLVDDMKENGFDLEDITDPKLSDIYTYDGPSLELHHGTVTRKS